jgi:YHS domain-containing protein
MKKSKKEPQLKNKHTMKLSIQLFTIAALSAVLFTACNSADQQSEAISNREVNKEAAQTSEMKQPTKPEPVSAAAVTYKKGDRVPNQEVCMVNDEYMGKKQIEVPYKGKTYYGCCEMCVERIPKDETVRMATDPQTGKKVDKTDAYIILLNEEGSVAYFANEKNYQQFLASHK